MPESTVVSLIDDKVSPGNPLFKELAGKAKVKSFPLLNKAKLRQWIERRVGEEGGRISAQAAEFDIGKNNFLF